MAVPVGASWETLSHWESVGSAGGRDAWQKMTLYVLPSGHFDSDVQLADFLVNFLCADELKVRRPFFCVSALPCKLGHTGLLSLNNSSPLMRRTSPTV